MAQQHVFNHSRAAVADQTELVALALALFHSLPPYTSPYNLQGSGRSHFDYEYHHYYSTQARDPPTFMGGRYDGSRAVYHQYVPMAPTHHHHAHWTPRGGHHVSERRPGFRPWTLLDETLIRDASAQESRRRRRDRAANFQSGSSWNWTQEEETVILNASHRTTTHMSPANFQSGSSCNWNQEEETVILNARHSTRTRMPPGNDSRLSEEVFSKYLKTRKCSKDEEEEEEEEPTICVVCQDTLSQENQTISTLRCGHGYHTNCIWLWLRRKNICPLCKSTALPVDGR